MRLISRIGIVGSSIFAFISFAKYGFISLDTSELISLTGLGLFGIFSFWLLDKYRDQKEEIEELWKYADNQQKQIDNLTFKYSKTKTETHLKGV